jgi:hypothetical protein
MVREWQPPAVQVSAQKACVHATRTGGEGEAHVLLDFGGKSRNAILALSNADPKKNLIHKNKIET